MALVIYCRLTDNILECTWAERSQAADNYRGESGVCAGLILRAAASTLSTYCDNLGLVRHTEWLSSPLLEKQAQADILRLYKKLLRELPFPVTCTYVKSHQDSGGCSYFDLSLEEKLNCRCYALAKDALVNTVAESTYIKSDFPFEDVRVHLNCEKLITSARRSFHDHPSYEQAKMAFDRKGLVDFDDFDLIYWDCMPGVLQRFPREFRTWLSKHVSECCGVNRFLSKWDKTVKNICPCCKRPNETVLHITKCTDPGRTKLFNKNVDELCVWRSKHDTPPELTHLIISYLLHRSTKPMSSFLSSYSINTAMAMAHDRLGWCSFLEGRISKILVQAMHDHLLNSTS